LAVDIWVSILFKLGFIAVITHLSLTKILPLLQDFLGSMFKDKKSMESLTSLLGILILILAGKEVLVVVEAFNNAALNYILTLGPAIIILSNLVYYLQYIIAAVLLVAILKAYKK
jgi:nucleoside permease NupC